MTKNVLLIPAFLPRPPPPYHDKSSFFFKQAASLEIGSIEGLARSYFFSLLSLINWVGSDGTEHCTLTSILGWLPLVYCMPSSLGVIREQQGLHICPLYNEPGTTVKKIMRLRKARIR